MARLCRICGETLVDFYYRCDDRSDSFYLCECGAVNPLKKSPRKDGPKFTNEWTTPGNVTVEEAPPRQNSGGYHVGKREIFPQEDRMVVG